jgi:PadR family transcriptional regulator
VAGPTRVTGPLLDVVEVFLQAFREDAQLHGWAIAKAEAIRARRVRRARPA